MLNGKQQKPPCSYTSNSVKSRNRGYAYPEMLSLGSQRTGRGLKKTGGNFGDKEGLSDWNKEERLLSMVSRVCRE